MGRVVGQERVLVRVRDANVALQQRLVAMRVDRDTVLCLLARACAHMACPEHGQPAGEATCPLCRDIRAIERAYHQRVRRPVASEAPDGIG